eukprot:749821-Prymnesium_polylepis.1
MARRLADVICSPGPGDAPKPPRSAPVPTLEGDANPSLTATHQHESLRCAGIGPPFRIATLEEFKSRPRLGAAVLDVSEQSRIVREGRRRKASDRDTAHGGSSLPYDPPHFSAFALPWPFSSRLGRSSSAHCSRFELGCLVGREDGCDSRSHWPTAARVTAQAAAVARAAATDWVSVRWERNGCA